VIGFDRASARDLRATFELRVRFRPGRDPMPFAVCIEGEDCRVRPGAASDPGATATISAGDLVRLAIGSIGWPELLSSGRLELAGDPFLALRLPALFRLPLGT
jgi:hypothetical protein